MQEYSIWGCPTLWDREKLKDERRERNKVKRVQKKEEKRQQKPAPVPIPVPDGEIKTNGLAIVSKEFMDGCKSQFEQKKVNAVDRKHPILLNIDIGETCSRKANSNRLNCGFGLTVSDNNDKGKSGEKEPKIKNKPQISSGNRLDSTQPVRSTGKHRINEKKRLSKLKGEIVRNNEQSSSLPKPYFNYCNNCITNNLEEYCEKFIQRVVELQENLFKRNPRKGDYKRRYFVGFHQIRRYLCANKIKILVIAKDLKILEENDPLHTTVKKCTDLAAQNNIPYLFALKRRQIGALTLKFLPISCIAVRDYDGANDEFKKIMEELEEISQMSISEQQSDVVKELSVLSLGND